jgi:hypothetical protein
MTVKKLLVLIGVMALVAALVVPIAASADAPTAIVSGTMPGESITVTPPSALNFGPFVLGMNGPVQAYGGYAGSVTAFANTWQVYVTASNAGFMRAAQDLATQLQISDGTISWVGAGTGFSYMGNPTSLPFEAEQNITGTDISHGAGSYTITITFTGALIN